MHIPVPISAALIHGVYQVLCATLRFHEKNRSPMDRINAMGERLVICLWHDELFPLMRMQKQLDIVTVVSPSRDGELLAQVLQRLGLRTARGSSGRGGVKALLQASRLMNKENVHACLTVDGPQGPRHKVKDGAIFLAHHADAWISPVRLRIEPSIRVHSWDKFQIPLPFSRITVRHGNPWKMPPGDLTEDALRAGRERLEKDLFQLGEDWGDKGLSENQHGKPHE